MVTTVTVVGTRTGGGGGAPSSSVGSLAPGSTGSRGDPHRSGLTQAEREANQRRRQAEKAAAASGNPATAAPSQPSTDDLPTVVVTSPREEPVTTVPTPIGDITIGAPKTLPFSPSNPGSPLKPSKPPGPSGGFLGPEPLPQAAPPAAPPEEVVVTAPRVPAPLLGALPNPVLTALMFGFIPQPANVGENKRARENILRDLAQRLLSVVPSVSRLAEPAVLPEVTVTASRLSDRALGSSRTAPTAPDLLGIRSPLRSLRVDYVPKPTSVLKPKPQKRSKPKVIGESGVKFDVNPVSIPLPSFISVPKPTPKLPPSVVTPPSVVAQPPIGGVPTLPPPGIVPIITPTTNPVVGTGVEPLPQFQGQCQCPSTETKTKRKHRRKERTKCYRGTYVERHDRVLKTKLTEVPCTAKSGRPRGTKNSRPARRTPTKIQLPGGVVLPKQKRKRK